MSENLNWIDEYCRRTNWGFAGYASEYSFQLRVKYFGEKKTQIAGFMSWAKDSRENTGGNDTVHVTNGVEQAVGLFGR